MTFGWYLPYIPAVGRDWCYLDPSLHAVGMDVILQTVIFAGVPKMYNSPLPFDVLQFSTFGFPFG